MADSVDFGDLIILHRYVTLHYLNEVLDPQILMYFHRLD